MSSSSNFCPNQNPNSRYLSSLLLHSSLYSRGVSTFLVFFFANANSHLLRATLEIYMVEHDTETNQKIIYFYGDKNRPPGKWPFLFFPWYENRGCSIIELSFREREREFSIHHIFWERRVFNPCDPFMQFQVPSVPPCKIILLLTVVLFLHISATVSLNFMPYIFFLLFERNPSYQERSTQHKNTIVFFFYKTRAKASKAK